MPEKEKSHKKLMRQSLLSQSSPQLHHLRKKLTILHINTFNPIMTHINAVFVIRRLILPLPLDPEENFHCGQFLQT